MPKILEMITSRKFWLTLIGMAGSFGTYLEGAIDLKTAALAAVALLLNYIFQLGREDSAKIAAGTK